MMASKTILSSALNVSRRSVLTLAGQSVGALGHATRPQAMYDTNYVCTTSARSLAPASARRSPMTAFRMYSTEIDMDQYHEVSDEALDYITDQYEELAEKIPEVDADLSVRTPIYQ